MTLPAFLEPENARIAIPVAMAFCYACYHLWRWRKTHRKAVVKPSAEIETAVRPNAAVPAVKPSADGQQESKQPLPCAPKLRTATESPAKMASANGTPARYPHYAEDTPGRTTSSHSRSPLERLYQKARAGDFKCYVSLGEHAWGRGALVEAHFWISLAKFNGVRGLDEWLRQIRMCWIQTGRLPEPENVYDQFPFDRSALAHAWMMLAAGFNVHANRDLIAKMEQDGSPDAKLILASLAR